jgi:hypothetical protein
MKSDQRLWRIKIRISFNEFIYVLLISKNTGLFHKKYTLSKIYFTKLLTLNPRPVYGWKGNLSSSDLNLRQVPGAHTKILSAKGSYVQCGNSWIINLTSAASHMGLT